MSAYSISFLFLLFSMSSAYGSAFATGLMLTNQQCSNQKNQLFTQAEQHEESFIKAYEQCSQTHDCDTHEEYLQAKYLMICSITQLMEHVHNLENDPIIASYRCEKAEAKNIRKRLAALLEKK